MSAGVESFDGSAALVTGASGAIGSAVVRLFRKAHARVFEVDVQGPEKRSPDFIQCDVSSASDIDALAERVGTEKPRLEFLIHCAGITRDAVIWKMDPEDWTRVLAVNLDSAFHLLHTFAPVLREGGSGAVVLVSSINGERGKFGQANYAASKAGLNALAKTAARELGQFGVRVNAVAPGLIETGMTRDLAEKHVRAAVEETALGRLGRPEDVANVTLFLCSKLSAHVTGQVIRVDGGQCTA